MFIRKIQINIKSPDSYVFLPPADLTVERSNNTWVIEPPKFGLLIRSLSHSEAPTPLPHFTKNPAPYMVQTRLVHIFLGFRILPY